MHSLVLQPSPTLQFNGNPPFDLDVVMQMGGLPYADTYKEQGCEPFKIAAKNEQMAKGQSDRMKRKNEGENSMNIDYCAVSR